MIEELVMDELMDEQGSPEGAPGSESVYTDVPLMAADLAPNPRPQYLLMTSRYLPLNRSRRST